jgi:hypothetical protein
VSADALQTRLFMDGEHLTLAGQRIVADYYYSLLVAPSEISFLAESTIQTTFQTITGIQQQINLSQRQRLAGWNVWMNGQVSELQIRNSSSGFPSDPGVPVSGTVGFDYHWLSGWLVGGSHSRQRNPNFFARRKFQAKRGHVQPVRGIPQQQLVEQSYRQHWRWGFHHEPASSDRNYRAAKQWVNRWHRSVSCRGIRLQFSYGIRDTRTGGRLHLTAGQYQRLHGERKLYEPVV